MATIGETPVGGAPLPEPERVLPATAAKIKQQMKEATQELAELQERQEKIGSQFYQQVRYTQIEGLVPLEKPSETFPTEGEKITLEEQIKKLAQNIEQLEKQIKKLPDGVEKSTLQSQIKILESQRASLARTQKNLDSPVIQEAMKRRKLIVAHVLDRLESGILGMPKRVGELKDGLKKGFMGPTGDFHAPLVEERDGQYTLNDDNYKQASDSVKRLAQNIDRETITFVLNALSQAGAEDVPELEKTTSEKTVEPLPSSLLKWGVNSAAKFNPSAWFSFFKHRHVTKAADKVEQIATALLSVESDLEAKLSKIYQGTAKPGEDLKGIEKAINQLEEALKKPKEEIQERAASTTKAEALGFIDRWEAKIELLRERVDELKSLDEDQYSEFARLEKKMEAAIEESAGVLLFQIRKELTTTQAGESDFLKKEKQGLLARLETTAPALLQWDEKEKALIASILIEGSDKPDKERYGSIFAKGMARAYFEITVAEPTLALLLNKVSPGGDEDFGKLYSWYHENKLEKTKEVTKQANEVGDLLSRLATVQRDLPKWGRHSEDTDNQGILLHEAHTKLKKMKAEAGNDPVKKAFVKELEQHLQDFAKTPHFMKLSSHKDDIRKTLQSGIILDIDDAQNYQRMGVVVAAEIAKGLYSPDQKVREAALLTAGELLQVIKDKGVLPRVNADVTGFESLLTAYIEEMKPEIALVKELSKLSPSIELNAQSRPELAKKLADLKLQDSSKKAEINELFNLLLRSSSLSVQKEIKLWKEISDNFLEVIGDENPAELLGEIENRVSQEDITKEARLFGCSEELAKLKMMNRLLVYKRAGVGEEVTPALAKRMEETGYSPSLLKSIEKAFKKHLYRDAKPQVVPLSETGKKAIFFKDNGMPRIIIMEQKAGAGSTKIVHFASSYFSMTTPEERRRYVAVQEIKQPTVQRPAPMEEEKPAAEAAAPAAPEEVKSALSTTAFIEVEVDVKEFGFIKEVYAEDVGEDYKKRRENEGEEELALEKEQRITDALKGVPHVIRTHFVVDLETGEKILIQEAAGYTLLEGEKVINLDDLRAAGRKREFTREENMLVFTLLYQAFGAMICMHAIGMIHRDIKGENILIMPDGKAAVADFDITWTQGTIKQPGGTPIFMAPECGPHGKVKIWNTISDKCDVWSSGMLLQSLLVSAGIYKHPLLERITSQYNELPEDKKKFLTEADYIARELGQLALPENKELREQYEKQYPEPENHNSLEHLIWWSTRIDPAERPTMLEFHVAYTALKDKLV